MGVGERVPGLDRDVPVADWAGRLPTGWHPEWLNAVLLDGQTTRMQWTLYGVTGGQVMCGSCAI